jgi:multiple sugar transport system ATP-binding protein
MSQIRLDQVTKSYGDVRVIPPLDLQIADKEFVVLVGPSGCGKTTSLRMIAGLESVTSGVVHIGERDVTGVRPGLRNCSMVFQNYALYPHMSVASNIGYGMKGRGTPKPEIDQAVTDAARILNLEEYLDRKPSALSGGQRQRVAIGRAIVRQPDVFLFDEPLSNLDAKLRIEMRTEIKRLHRRLKTTIVYVTHDQVEAMTMADRVVVMN